MFTGVQLQEAIDDLKSLLGGVCPQVGSNKTEWQSRLLKREEKWEGVRSPIFVNVVESKAPSEQFCENCLGQRHSIWLVNQ